MMANRLGWFLVFLLGSAVLQLPAQQSEADSKLLADIRAKAEKGDAQSQFEMGKIFWFGKFGVATNYAEAVKWVRKAAEQNHAEAQNNLGFWYGSGQGVAKDYVEAVKWWRKAAEQNYANAQFNLGYCYAIGQGVAQDAVEAVKWWRKAAEQNYAQAQFSLGLCYYNAKGVAKDAVEAVKWYRKAAEQNFAEAQCNLGVCYYAGEGVTKDYVEAYKWLSLASAQGDENAKGAKSSLAQQMTPEQIAKGFRLAREFKPGKALEPGAPAPSR